MEYPLYSQIFSGLSNDTAIVTFKKKDNTIRTMICTRNRYTIEGNCGDIIYQLLGKDKHCNINNGNMSVIDIAIGEARSFNINNLINIEYLGEIKTPEEYTTALAKYLEAMQRNESLTEKDNI